MIRHLIGTLCLFLLLGWLPIIQASQHGHHSHDHLHKRHNNTASYDSNYSAKEVVEEALKALRIANKLRVDNSQFNKWEFQNSESDNRGSSAVPLSDYLDSMKNTSLARLVKRSVTNNSNPLESNPKYGYTLSPEIAKAAKEVAESQKPTPWDVDYASIASKIRAKWSTGTNDTNAMIQKLSRSNGLDKYTSFDQPDGLQTSIGHENAKRDTSSYWMASLEQNGASPYAESGYKIWRNVMDYGAKGDGVTDDTHAINRAISDGNRCGANCKSSTRYPAVVWFPSGTYLVSSPIVQYYNTQLLGDPTNLPTILAASSFVGLGVITSDVYVGDSEEWYLNTNNFLRSIRNFKMDITRTDQSAYVCAIHWQVAQGTSLENIEFYMLQNVEGNTQQGIYMENGSGGFLADLTFVGGNFGAYFGNQQFTTSHLVFVNCNTALQIHWDWAWTMQDVVIESCRTGMALTGGAGGSSSTGQSLGSFILVDAIIANTPTGIMTSLLAENSTSLLLQNVGFFNVKDSVADNVLSKVLLAGGNEVLIDNWGFGRVTKSNGETSFINGASITSMVRTDSLLSTELAYVKPNFYTRRRPKYVDIGQSQIINLKTAGAKGDGVTDDTTALNSIFAAAANMSSIVYVPYGVYVVTDTVKIPVGSRIIGQAWPQIMGKGKNFADQLHARAVVQVGEPDESGVVEIQDMMFTVSGATAGAILVQWNVHEITRGSVGFWDSHFRVGGAKGSELQADKCPKGGGINMDCIAASALLHITSKASAYIENSWAWVADHDLDASDEAQIDVFSGRGILIESQGPTWLYGTASEHNVLYQYQLSSAKDVVMGMIQTESPYFQSYPDAPLPIVTGGFPNDPHFDNCKVLSLDTCAVSWAVRIVESSSVYILGAGLYSWFSRYSQDCLATENCQDRAFEVEESQDLWIYNLVTKAIVEMISPVNEKPTFAKDNKNGFMSSILAWLEGSSDTTGQRVFPGFTIYDADYLPSTFSDACVTALTATIKCDLTVFQFGEPQYHGTLGNDTLTDLVCDQSCGNSLASWLINSEANCDGAVLLDHPATILGGYMWTGWNETCYKDPSTGKYCNDIISQFTRVASVELMPKEEMCSYCYKTKLEMMQSSPYSYYTQRYKYNLETVITNCGFTANTTIPDDLSVTEPEDQPFCPEDKAYTTKNGDTCTSIALDYSVASAALYMGNQDQIRDCSQVVVGQDLCLPPSCEHTYILQSNDTCLSIEEANADIMFDNSTKRIIPLRQVNPWIDTYCSNLQGTSWAYGKVLCLTPQSGMFNATYPVPTSYNPWGTESSGYGTYIVPPPENATVAAGSTEHCGKWHTAVTGNSCAQICIENKITSNLFLAVNPSLQSSNCTELLVSGNAYCTRPMRGWNYTVEAI
ncbi:pectin lyase-like protein [Penicillium frequentans]|uniref:Pectin lyase-like protein n=1 Tax=Penicillium frequentans TaxID=3151616 RepID=A0AAD6D369_9EURO|nr:pectin lyase-like protein [Penicillium glabrum]